MKKGYRLSGEYKIHMMRHPNQEVCEHRLCQPHPIIFARGLTRFWEFVTCKRCLARRRNKRGEP